MKTKKTNDGYFSQKEKIIFDDNFDYTLYRQDINGTESVYFNIDEIFTINKKINSGKILINPSYSVLLCKNKKAYKVAPNYGCYTTINIFKTKE